MSLLLEVSINRMLSPPLEVFGVSQKITTLAQNFSSNPLNDAAQTFSMVDLKDDSAFEQVFRTFYGALAGFATKYVSDPDIAEEIVQETFTSIWTKADEINIETNIKSYLYGAVRNACLNHIKHQKVVREHQSYELHRVSEFETGFDFLELDELQQKVDAAMDKLPEKCREVFELSRFEELKYKEIADQLNISIKTVENQMGKALRILREELGQYLPLFLLFLELWHGGKF